MTVLANRYDIQATLGTGATSVVYQALDRETGRVVALKQLATPEASARALFRHEFRSLQRFRHPGLLMAFDQGETEAGPYFTMEQVAGAAFPSGPLPAGYAGDRLVELARILAHLHAEGVVHGDLKPENLRYDSDGQLKLLDLGFLQPAGRPGQRRGTPEYMAPEVIRGEPTDPRSDLYALGVIGYQLLTGALPFEADDPLVLLRRQLEAAPPDLAPLAPGAPLPLVQAVMACLAKHPADRPASVGHFLAEAGLGENETAYLVFGSQVFGRDAAIAELTSQLRAQVGGLAPALTLTGPVGIGKSRLLTAARAAMPDLPVLTATGGEDAPFRLATTLLEEAEALMTERGWRADDELWKPLRALVPAWGEAPAPLDPRNQENRLRQALALLLGALGGHAGLVVALDDWHRADAASRDLLAPLLAGTAAPGVAFVLTQPTAPEDDGPHLPLGPLDRASVAALLETALSGALPAGLLDLAVERAQGNPAHLRDLLGFWLSRGALTHAHGAWRFEPQAAQDLLLDESAALSLHLDALDAEALAVGRAAAVLGHAFPLAHLEALVEDPYAGLAALEAAGLVMRRGDRVSFLGTAHEALLATLSESDAGPLHRRAAALFTGATDVAGLTQAARHHLHGRTPEAAEAALTAARANLGLGALGAALSLLQAMPNQRETLSPAQALERARLLGDLARMRGDGAEAIARYEEAIALARAAQDDAALCRELVSAGRTAMMLSNGAEARRYLDEALPLARRLQLPAQEARALMTLGRVSFFAGDVAPAQALYQTALQVADASSEQGLKADALSFLGVMAPAGSAEGRTYLAEAVALHRALANPLGLIDASINLGDRRLAAGDLAGAQQIFTEALTVCRQVGSRNEESFVLLNLAQTAIEAGRPLEAESAAERAYDLAAGLTQWYPAGYARVLASQARAALGRFEAARAAVLEGLTLASETGNKYLEGAARVAEAQLLLDTGDADGARAATAALVRSAEAGNDPLAAARARGLQGRAQLLSGEPEAAATALSAATDAAQAAGARYLATQLGLWTARALLLMGRSADAATRADAALKNALELGADGLVVQARWLTAECHRLSGRAPQAYDLYSRIAAYGSETAQPQWEALGLAGVSQTRSGGEATEARQRARLLMQGLIAAARPTDLTTWPEFRLDEGQAAAPSGVDDLTGLLEVLEGATSFRDLLHGLLARLLAATEAEAGGLLAYQASQLSDYALSGISEQRVTELPLVDEALWSQRPVLEPTRWAFPVSHDDEVIAVLYLEDAATSREPLVQALLGGLRYTLSHFLELQALQSHVERLAFSEALARRALIGPTPEAVGRHALTAVLQTTRAERAFLLTLTPDGELAPVLALDHRGQALPADAKLSRSVSRHVVETGESVRLLDPQQSDQWQKQQSILALGLQMIIAVPVRREGVVVGVLYVDSSNVASLLGAREQGLLEAAAEILGLGSGLL